MSLCVSKLRNLDCGLKMIKSVFVHNLTCSTISTWWLMLFPLLCLSWPQDSGLSLSVVADATVEAREDTGTSPTRWSKTSKASAWKGLNGEPPDCYSEAWEIWTCSYLVEWNHDGTYEKIFWNKRFFEDNKGRVGIPPSEVVVFSWGDPGI